MKRVLVLALAAVTLCCCASAPFDLSAAAAERDAQRDIAAGRPQIFLAGGRGSSAVGISYTDLYLVRDLPRNSSLTSGCSDKLLRERITYAKEYNGTVLRYLRSHPRQA